MKSKKQTYDKGEFSGETLEETPTQRPYSRGGWYLYIGASDNWLREFKKTAKDDFLRVIEQIENAIDTQQWQGATVGAFNANIIARTLGLKDHSDVTTKGKEVNTIINLGQGVNPDETTN